jgi:4-hydroxybenzoate polyprenyltransferase
MVGAIYTLFARRLRLSNPWNYKAPVIMAFAYMVVLWGGIAWPTALAAFGCSVLTIAGIAGVGYLSNDWGDRAADLRAGKPNLLANLPGWHVAALLALFLCLAIGPWVLYFPSNAFSLGLLAAEFLLLALYILPPVRLKERGWLGVLADALYAHVNPALLAILTFGLMAVWFEPDGCWLDGPAPDHATPAFLRLPGHQAVFPTASPLGIRAAGYTMDGFPAAAGILLLAMALLWQFLLGIRNILLHQLKDADNDRRSGTHTLVTRRGEERVWRMLGTWVVPTEVLAWLGLLGLLCMVTTLPLAAFLGHIALRMARPHRHLDLRGWLYGALDDFYIPVFPLTFLLALCLLQPWFLILAGLHVLLFKNAFSPWRDRLLRPILPLP